MSVSRRLTKEGSGCVSPHQRGIGHLISYTADYLESHALVNL
jgi:hypothetical protein